MQVIGVGMPTLKKIFFQYNERIVLYLLQVSNIGIQQYYALVSAQGLLLNKKKEMLEDIKNM